jgi:soluble lytic murein transglycosylase-like protein
MTKIKIGVLAIVSLTVLLHIIPKNEHAVMECSIAATPEPIVETIEHAPAMLVEETAEQEEEGPEIYNVPLNDALQRYAYNLCVDYEVEEYYPLVLAVMWRESEFVPTIISKTNDYGLMQINKINHKWLSDKLKITDFLDEEQNIHAGVFMLSLYLHKYRNIDKALMAYNMGESGAKKHWAAGTYTTNYTRSTRERLELILSGEGYQK